MIHLSSNEIEQTPATATVGSWTNARARTGCTVVLFSRPVRTYAEIRGGATGTREIDLLQPGMLVQRADAILLSGGSAFGLDATGGVMQFLLAQNRGFATSAGPVPIVPAAILYDLAVGQPVVPGAKHAKQACQNAVPLEKMQRGQVGVGTGATTQKLWGPESVRRGGLGYAAMTTASGSVTAIVAVNAAGSIVDSASGRSAYDTSSAGPGRLGLLDAASSIVTVRESTTLAIVIIDSPISQDGLIRAAIAANDGMARSIVPCHTLVDGDVVFIAALQESTSDAATTLKTSVIVELAVEQAIVDAVTH